MRSIILKEKLTHYKYLQFQYRLQYQYHTYNLHWNGLGKNIEIKSLILGGKLQHIKLNYLSQLSALDPHAVLLLPAHTHDSL